MENIVFDRIRRDINSHSVVLYMKGTAAFPMCGFSAAVVQTLTQMGVLFRDINVLEDSVIRQGIKQFAAWPTIPQLYIKGAFIGGADIVREMYASGELQALLQKHGILIRETA